MKVTARLQPKIRKYYLNNPNYTLQQIANHFNLSKSTISELLSKNDMYIVASLYRENRFYLFNRNFEKEIKTDNDNYVINSEILTHQEKIFIKFFGLLID
jgi:hypothetical protein